MCHKVEQRDMEQSEGGHGGGCRRAKVSPSLRVIYWHITRLNGTRVCALQVWMCMSLLTHARAQCHRQYSTVQSGFLFFSLHIMTVLFFIGVRWAVPLISVLHSLSSSSPHSLSFAPSLAPSSDNLIKAPRACGPPSSFITVLHSLGRNIVWWGFSCSLSFWSPPSYFPPPCLVSLFPAS